MSARHPTKRAEDTGELVGELSGARKRQDSSKIPHERVGRPFRLVRARVITFPISERANFAPRAYFGAATSTPPPTPTSPPPTHPRAAQSWHVR